MGTVGTLLTPEAFVTGISGLVIAGLIIRGFIKGWVEGKTQAVTNNSNTAAMVGAVALTWEREQRELILQTHIRIAVALEQIVAQQRDEHERTMEEKLDELLKRMDR